MLRRCALFSVTFVTAALAVSAALFSGSAAALPPPDPQTGKGPWELVRNDHGITVHRRTVVGSKLHEFRGTAIIEAPIASVLGVLNDSAHRLEWMKEAVANIRIQQPDPYTEVFYSRTRAPWPVADRDVVLRAHTTFDTVARQVRIDISSLEHPLWPPQKGAVRMPFLRGHWYLWPERGGAWTRAEYQIHADPAGLLPDWIINLASKKIPHDTIAGMQQQVKRRRYIEFEERLTKLPEYQAVVDAGSAEAAAPSPASAAGTRAAAAPAAEAAAGSGGHE